MIIYEQTNVLFVINKFRNVIRGASDTDNDYFKNNHNDDADNNFYDNDNDN